MNFDPAIAARQALHRAEDNGELGDFRDEIIEAEEAFSSDAGQEAKRAYEHLQQLGEQLPEARAFQEFLIYITWQQVTEETIARHFQKGVELCEQFLAKFEEELLGSMILNQVIDIQESFRGGLGLQEDPMPEYEEDMFKGGD